MTVMITSPDCCVRTKMLHRALCENTRVSSRLQCCLLFGIVLSYTSLTRGMLRQISEVMTGVVVTAEEKLESATTTTKTSSTEGAKQIAASVEDDTNPRRLCVENPYQSSFSDSLEVIAQRADAWLDTLTDKRLEAQKSVYGHIDHARFFPFNDTSITACARECVGGACSSDESKIVCGLSELQKERQCIIYSIGGNNQWDFEIDLLQRTTCEIHTFDCTGPSTRFQKPSHDRLKFHHVCLGTEHEDAPANCTGRFHKCGATWTLLEMQLMLGHDRIDLLKMDIETFEWPILLSWPLLLEEKDWSRDVTLPMQVLVEIHYWTHITERRRTGKKYKSAIEMVDLQARFLQMGYVVAVRDDNPKCTHCTELTLVRYRCLAKSAE